MNSNPDFGTSGNSVWNQQYFDFLNETFFPKIDITTIADESNIMLDRYQGWIESSTLNKFKGLDAFPMRYASVGTTQGLDWWHYYCAVNNLDLKMFRGEYPYHRDAYLQTHLGWDDCIEDCGLVAGDAVVVSVPFSATGRLPVQWEDLIKTCNRLKIPVFVDCAWFGTCFGITVNLDEPCIKMVAFSTTKGLSCGNWRAGIVFSKVNEKDFKRATDGSLETQTDWNHGNHLNTAIANRLMAEFSPDTIPKKYMASHIAVCKHYGLIPTQTVHIAEGARGTEWDEFHRDETYNRINISKALKRHKNKGNFYDNI